MTFLWGAIIVLVALCFRVVFVGAPLGSDDAIYFDYAANISFDMFDTSRAQWPFRIGLILPLSLVQAIFGETVIAYYVFTFIFSVGLVVVVYAIMLRTTSRLAAVLAALLVSTSALVLYQGTHILPDTPNLCFLLLSCLVFFAVDDWRGKRDRWLLVFAAGLAFYAYLIRMPNMVFLIALPVYEWLRFRSVRRTLVFSAAFAGFVALECAFYWVVAGNPLKRIQMVPKGVTLWVVHQPVISWFDYILGPFAGLMKWKSGWLFLAGGVLGMFRVIREKNYALCSLAVGGLAIFLVYSYPVTSFDPLKRALPLQYRYVVAFSCALAMLTAYGVVGLIRSQYRYKRLVRGLAVGLVALGGCLQVAELPRMARTLFIKDRGHALGSMLVEDFAKRRVLDAPVHAYPESVFRMFSGYSALNLVPYSPHKVPVAGNYYLIYKPRMVRTVRYARIQNKQSVISNGGRFLSRNPAWDYLLETESIMLVRVSDRPLQRTVVLELGDHADIWHAGHGIVRSDHDGAPSFQIPVLDKHAYISMFDTKFSKPWPQQHPSSAKLDPDAVYTVTIDYELTGKLSSLGLFLREYDGERGTQVVRGYLDTEPGVQQFSTEFTTSLGYDSFRMFLRITNRHEPAELTIKRISFARVTRGQP